MSKLGNVPVDLKQRKQWVCWKYHNRHGKETKVPFQVNGEFASSSDPSTWSTFKEAVEASASYEGVGFVFAENDCYVGIDLDGCINDKTNKMEEWAREVVLMMDSYAEISPSGTGVKIFGSSSVRWAHRKKVELPFEKVCPKSPAIEVYDCGRYFAVTGRRLQGMVAVTQVDMHFDWLADKFDMRYAVPSIDGAGVRLESPVSERASKYIAKIEGAVSGSGGHNRLFHVCCVLVMGFGMSENEALALLKSEYNPRCVPPWNDAELTRKVREAAKQPGARGYLRDANPSDWEKIRIPSNYRESVKPPEEKVKEPETSLRITSMKDAAAAYLSMLASGKQSLIDTGIPDVDQAIGGGVALGEMLVIAARPSHGKSAVALQMAHTISKDGLPIAIVSEEMSAIALGKRTIQYLTDTPEEHWKHESEKVMSDVERHFKKRADVFIIESCGSVERACEEIEKLVVSNEVKVAIIDYAQLLRSKGKDRYEQITRVSQTLRMMASRLQILVIVLAQLNREIESRKKFVPMMSDIKETGQLEQDADVIIFGVWPHRIDSSLPAKNYQFYIAKNRNRAINSGLVECEFIPSRQKLIQQQVEYVEFEGYHPTDNYRD